MYADLPVLRPSCWQWHRTLHALSTFCPIDYVIRRGLCWIRWRMRSSLLYDISAPSLSTVNRSSRLSSFAESSPYFPLPIHYSRHSSSLSFPLDSLLPFHFFFLHSPLLHFLLPLPSSIPLPLTYWSTFLLFLARFTSFQLLSVFPPRPSTHFTFHFLPPYYLK